MCHITHRLIRNTAVFFTMVLLFCACDEVRDTVPFWNGKKRIVLKEELVVGTEDVENENYFFGNVTDIKVDQFGHIYVADSGMFRIQKYAPDGTYIRSFGHGQGYDPGQFISLRGIDVDSTGNVYALDFEKRSITVFDSTGNVVRCISSHDRMKPLKLVLNKDHSINVVGSGMTYKGPLVHKFDRIGSVVKAFCKRAGIHEMAFQAGECGSIAVDRDGNLYYSQPYPYEIRKYSPDDVLIQTYSREVSFYKPPTKITVQGQPIPVSMSGSKGLAVLPDGKIMHIIFRLMPDYSPEFHLDVFSSEGDFLFSSSLSEFGIEHYGAVAVDREGNLYISHTYPYPKVVKYTRSVVDTFVGPPP